MHKTSQLATAMFIVVALSAISATYAAAALPEGLPIATEKEPITGTGVTGKVHIETVGGKIIECEKGKGAGEATSPKLGSFKNKFEGCKAPSLGVNCNGLADESGKISVEGQVHLWYGLLSEKLVLASVLLPKQTHLMCGGIILLIMSGCSAGLVLEPNVLLKTGKVDFLQTKGKDDIPRVFNEKGELIECTLLLSVNEGPLEGFAEEGTAELKEAKQNGKEIEVLAMA